MPRFPCLLRRKYPSENAEKGISECLCFKIFWEEGACPQTPLQALAFGTPAYTSTFSIQPATQKLTESPE